MTLVAREAALAALREAFLRAEGGHGAIVLVRGEPGIGKSSLAAAFVAEAEARGAAVSVGRTWELGEAPPYFPLRPCLQAVGIEAFDATDAFAAWERVLGALAAASRDRAAVWVVEDAHAADLHTLDLLAFLARPVSALRALIVITTRDRDPRISERAALRLGRLARDGVLLALEPLTLEDVGALAARVVGRELPGAEVAELFEITAGNPLFVVECARAYRASGAAPRSALPHTIREVVAERLQLLPVATQKTLAAFAVLGREAGAAALAKTLGVLPARAIEALTPALDAGVVVERRPGHFAFSHIVVRDAAFDAIRPAERAELHLAAATALAAQGDGVEVLVERARHALASLHLEADGHALAWRAASVLAASGAFDRAYAVLQRLDDARAAGGAPTATSDEALRFARIAQSAGRHAEARAACMRVLDAARAAGDAELLARAALVLGSEIRPATVDSALVAALEEARSALGDRSPALACRVVARLAAARQPAPNPNEPIAMAREVIARARALGDESLLLDVLHVAGAALVDFAPSEERIALHEEVLSRATKVDDMPKALGAVARLALDRAEVGDLSAFEDAVQRALDLATRAKHPRHRWRALLLGSMRALARGDVAQSDRFIVEVQELASLTDDPALALSLAAHVAQAAMLVHRDDERTAREGALDRTMAGVALGAEIAATLRASTLARLEDGAAAAELAKVPSDSRLLETPFFVAMLAEAAAFTSNVAWCARLRAKLAGHPAVHVVSGHVPMTYEGPRARVLGLLDAALGDSKAAEASLREALAIASEQGYRPWVAQCAYDLALVLERAGRKSEARAELARAAEIADDVGMPGLARRARAHAGAARVAPSAPPPVRAPLTFAREGDVWRIAHQGRALRVKDSRGVRMLARLVELAGEEVHVLALASDDPAASLHDAPAGDVLDARALREYKERLADLAISLEDAERDADLGRAATLRREKELLEAEVARAAGLGGSSRSHGSASERARVNVQRRLKDAIAKIAAEDAAIGAYLEKAVRTGTYCRFFG